MLFIIIGIAIVIWALCHDAETAAKVTKVQSQETKPIALPLVCVGIGAFFGPIGFIIMGLVAYALYTA